jgi:hypothetical protein
MAVFDSLAGLVAKLGEHAVVLTPHLLSPEQSERAILDNELSSLRHGAFNLGFLGVRNDDEGRAFAEWWSSRLIEHCYDDPDRGLFVDQKWVDLAPALFERVGILRDPGLNVASWNLSHRVVRIHQDGRITADDAPLRFMHFTKLGPVGMAMTERYAGDDTDVYELWAWYRNAVAARDDSGIPVDYWHYGSFEDGSPIPRAARRLFRDHRDIQERFSDPFASGRGSFQEWYAKHPVTTT